MPSTSKVSSTAALVLLMPSLSVPLKLNASPIAKLTGTANSAAMPRLVMKIRPVAGPISKPSPSEAELPIAIFMTFVPLARVVCSRSVEPTARRRRG